MPQRIGFDRTVKLAWLDRYAWRCRAESDPQKLREFMHDFLHDECPHQASRIKNITVLHRIWSLTDPGHLALRQEALEHFEQASPPERVALHWGMCLLAYPFFREIAAACGRLLKLQPEFSWRQIRAQLYQTWGTRPTLERAVSRVIISMSDWGALEATGETSFYRPAPPLNINSRIVVHWLLQIALIVEETGALPVEKTMSLPYLFPFHYSLTLAGIQRSDRFRLSRQGDGITLIEMASQP